MITINFPHGRCPRRRVHRSNRISHQFCFGRSVSGSALHISNICGLFQKFLLTWLKYFSSFPTEHKETEFSNQLP